MESLEDHSPVEEEGGAKVAKKGRIIFDLNYIESSRDEEDIAASIASLDSISDRSSLPSSPIFKSTKAAKATAVVKATTIMKSKRNMKVSRKANDIPPKGDVVSCSVLSGPHHYVTEIFLEVPYLNGAGIEIATRFGISVDITALDKFITVMLCHIQCPDLNPNSWLQNLLYRTTADKVKTRYPLDSDALWSKLKDEYFEEYKHKGVLAHATIYLTPQFLRDLQFTLKQCKPSKPTGSMRNSGKKGNELLTNLDNPDSGVETTNDIPDAAVGFTGTVKPQAIALQAALKCVDHPGVHCHRDKQGNHHTMNFPQRCIWIKALCMCMAGDDSHDSTLT
ncbi:hypothetical protein K439DRAFT_1625043 [Ramaria rubella]|nr:hypothetical protein K439DRAFT_1625043 [Ramaria rubella]